MIKNKITDFMKSKRWVCNSCGACCSYMTPLVDNGKFEADWVDKSGRCKNLIKIADKFQCLIYETRPDICRVDKTLMPHYTDREIAKMCRTLKDYQDQK